MTETVMFRRNGHLAHIILNNVRRHNALGREQLEAIQTHLKHIASEQQVRVLVLTGAGDRTFCSGASLQDLSDGRMGEDVFQATTEQLAALAIPTICALNGNVFGGGVELALSCDFRIGVRGSRLRVPAAELGLCYPVSGINRFVESLGLNTTRRMLLAAEEFDENDMLNVGFLHHLVEPQDLTGFTLRFAQRIAGLAPLALQAMKRILRQTNSIAVEPCVARELAAQCLESSDLQEGLAAKRERRSPRFEGR